MTYNRDVRYVSKGDIRAYYLPYVPLVPICYTPLYSLSYYCPPTPYFPYIPSLTKTSIDNYLRFTVCMLQITTHGTEAWLFIYLVESYITTGSLKEMQGYR